MIGRFLEVTSPYYWHLFQIPIPTHLLGAPPRNSARECIAVSVVGSPGHHIRQTVPAECGWLHRWKSKIDTQNSLVRWFQPLWKFEYLPQIGVKIKNIGKPPPSRHVWKEIHVPKAHHFGYPAAIFRGLLLEHSQLWTASWNWTKITPKFARSFFSLKERLCTYV